MNAVVVRRLLLDLGFEPTQIQVVGERSGDLRFFTVSLQHPWHARAGEVKQAVLALIQERGLGGGCDVVSSETGRKLA